LANVHEVVWTFVKLNRWTVVSFAALALVLGGWAVASPAGSSPDDQYHLASIWCGQGERAGLCEVDDAGVAVQVPAPIPGISCFAFDATATPSSCQLSRHSEDASQLRPTLAFDQGFYPPVYYWFTSFFASSDPYVSNYLIRSFNVLLFMGLLIATWAISSSRVRPALLLANALLIAPLGLAIVGSTNPSAWSYAALSVYWAALIAYLDAIGSRRAMMGLLLLVIALVGAGARSDAAVWIVLSTTIILIFHPVRHWSKRIDGAVGVALAALLGWSMTSASQGEIATGGLDASRDVSNVDLWFRNLGEIVRVSLGSLGSSPLGWLDTPMYSVTAILGTAIVISVLFAYLVDRTRREYVAITIAVALLIAAPLYLLGQGRNVVGEVVQARYVFGWMPIIAGLILLQGRRWRRLSTAQAMTVSLILSVSHLYSLHQQIRRYVTGLDVPGLDLNRGFEWWWTQSRWLSPNVVWTATAAFYVCFIAASLAAYCAVSPAATFSDPDDVAPVVGEDVVLEPSNNDKSAAVTSHTTRRRTGGSSDGA
jgi:hypothetical protein